MQRELLSGKLWAVFIKAEGGFRVEVSSSAGSVVPDHQVIVVMSNDLWFGGMEFDEGFEFVAFYVVYQFSCNSQVPL